MVDCPKIAVDRICFEWCEISSGSCSLELLVLWMSLEWSGGACSRGSWMQVLGRAVETIAHYEAFAKETR